MHRKTANRRMPTKGQLRAIHLVISRVISRVILLGVTLLIAWIALPATADAQAEPPTQLTNFQVGGHSSEPTTFAELDGKLLFAAYHEGESKLWRSDGTAAGTVVLTSLPRRPDQLFVIDHNAYFSLYNSTADHYEIWETDGTQAGSGLRTTIPRGSSNTIASVKLSAFDDGLLIVTNDAIWRIFDRGDPTETPHHVYTFDGREDSGYEMTEGYVIRADTTGDPILYVGARVEWEEWGLWQSDGTAAGTTLVFGGLAGISTPVLFGDQLLFTAETGSAGWELWKSDGTTDGTILLKDINPGPASSSITPADYQDEHFFYFSADDGTHGQEVWRTNGTAAGTVLVRDASPNPQSRYVEFIDFQDQLYVMLQEHQLWKVTADGTDMLFVATLPQWSDDILVVTDSAIYFVVLQQNGTYDFWKTDGSIDGTVLLAKELVPPIPPFGPVTWPPSALQIGDQLFWGIRYDEHGAELWKSDADFASLTLVKDIQTAWDGLTLQEATVLDGTFYGAWTGIFDYSAQLLASDGTVTGTQAIAGALLDAPVQLQNDGEALYVQRDGELWRSTDPSGDATQLSQFGNEYSLRSFVVAESQLYAVTTKPIEAGQQLWVGPKTTPGLQRIAAWEGKFAAVGMLHTVGNRLFFEVAAGPGRADNALWSSDGTETGTHLLLNGDIEAMWAFDGQMLIQITGAEGGPTLLISNGTLAGTHPIDDSLATVANAGIAVIGRFPGYFLFTTYQPEGSSTLWRSVGSAAGTLALTELPQPQDRWSIQHLTTVDEVTYFAIGQEGENGGQTIRLVRSDGTETGTWVINDEHSGVTIRGYPAAKSASLDGILYLLPRSGAQLWRTDGTHVATAPVASLHPEFDLTEVTDLFQYKGQLILVADSERAGQQLWRYQPGAVEILPRVYLPLIGGQ